jgi:hypothetical protein
LTRFYNEYKLVKAATLAGHVPGSKVMKHYVALTEQQLKEEESPSLSIRVCPNPSCGVENDPHQKYCSVCSSPLDKKVFSEIFEKQIDEMLETKIQLIKTQLENKLLKS